MRSRNLTSQWTAPLYLAKRVSGETFKVRSVQGYTALKIQVHVNRMKLCHDRNLRPTGLLVDQE